MSTITRFQDVIWEEPTFPPRPLRKVIFSLLTRNDGIYFVNNSKDILTRVRSDSYGFIDDGLVGNNPCFTYENVLVNEAVLVESSSDIEKAMNWDVKVPVKKPVQTSLFAELTSEEQKLVDLLKGGDRFIDEMTIETQLPMSKVSALLLGLEFKGLVVSLPGKMYRIK